MYTLTFAPQALEDLAKLKKSEPAAFKKAGKLLGELQDHPKTGTGKPEALSGDRSGLLVIVALESNGRGDGRLRLDELCYLAVSTADTVALGSGSADDELEAGGDRRHGIQLESERRVGESDGCICKSCNSAGRLSRSSKYR